MRFDPPLVRGVLLRRYKRFLADVRLDDGSEIVAHIANTGSMSGCFFEGGEIALSHHPDSGRKLPWSWQLTKTGDHWICVNTALTNRIIEEAILGDQIPPLRGYPTLRREVKYGEKSRIDLLLEDGPRRCYVEVKNVTLKEGNVALFPDAVTERGTRHLEELKTMVMEGHRAVMVYCVNRTDCDTMAPADLIDPVYGRTLREAAEAGVELLAYRTAIDTTGIQVEAPVPIQL